MPDTSTKAHALRSPTRMLPRSTRQERHPHRLPPVRASDIPADVFELAWRLDSDHCAARRSLAIIIAIINAEKNACLPHMFLDTVPADPDLRLAVGAIRIGV